MHTSLPTEMRRRVQQALKTRDFRSALRSTTGAIDLASIMVGVIVIGVIAGVIAATVFAVIPWSQNAAAKQNLDAVRTAESVSQVGAGKFLDMAALVATKQIQSASTVNVVTDAAGACYAAASKSVAGPVYISSNLRPIAALYMAGDTSPCTDLTALVASVGGPDPAAAPLPDQFATLTAVQSVNGGGRKWAHVASSADGQKLVASIQAAVWTTPTDNLYTSTDAGVTWTAQPGSGLREWISLASSADGTRLVAGTEGSMYPGGSLYLSTDSGVTWMEQTAAGYGTFGAIAISPDGMIIYGNSTALRAERSIDGGLTWTHIDGLYKPRLTSVAMSADGAKLVGGENHGWLSTNSTTWGIGSPYPTVGNRAALKVAGVASSASGKNLVVSYCSYYCQQPSTIFTSADSGATWTERVNAGIRYWTAPVTSADGTKIVVADRNGYIYTSSDAGVTWVERANVGAKTWFDVAMSADGSKIVATDRKNVYTATFGP